MLSPVRLSVGLSVRHTGSVTGGLSTTVIFGDLGGYFFGNMAICYPLLASKSN